MKLLGPQLSTIKTRDGPKSPDIDTAKEKDDGSSNKNEFAETVAADRLSESVSTIAEGVVPKLLDLYHESDKFIAATNTVMSHWILPYLRSKTLYVLQSYRETNTLVTNRETLTYFACFTLSRCNPEVSNHGEERSSTPLMTRAFSVHLLLA